MNNKRKELTEEQKAEIQLKMRTCPCCKKELKSVFLMRYLRGIADTKTSRACIDCAESHFEEVKSQFFVEEYEGNKFYKYNDKYFPYWEANYCFDTLEGLRARTDDLALAVVDMRAFHMINNMMR